MALGPSIVFVDWPIPPNWSSTYTGCDVRPPDPALRPELFTMPLSTISCGACFLGLLSCSPPKSLDFSIFPTWFSSNRMMLWDIPFLSLPKYRPGMACGPSFPLYAAPPLRRMFGFATYT